MPTSILLVKGIGPATADKLTTAGIATAEDLVAATPEQLADVPGFGKFRGKQVIAQALQLVTPAATDSVISKDQKPSVGKTGVAKSKKGKASKKSESEKKVEKKKGKKDKLKKDKGKADKGKKDKGKKDKRKKTGEKKKAKKKKK